MSTEFSERLRLTRKSKKLTQEALAEMCGITKRSVINYESGSRMPSSLEITNRLADALGVPVEYLLGIGETTRVKLLGGISCGPLNFADDCTEDEFDLPVSFTGQGEFFMLYANGESMLDIGISPGDLVLIRRQNYADSGQIAVVCADGETTLKRFYPDPRNRRVRLHPENKNMRDIFLPSSDVAVEGVAVKVIKELK